VITSSLILGPILAWFDPHAAPIITRLGRIDGARTLVEIVRGAMTLFVVSILAGIIHLVDPKWLIFHDILSVLIGAVMVIAVVVLVALPPMIAGLAGHIAAQDVHSQMFPLMGLTPLSGQAIFQGYFIASLSRARIPLALAAGLIPLYAFALAEVSLALALRGAFEFVSVDFGLRLIYYLLIGVGLWGMNLLGTAIGVNLALQGRSVSVSRIFAPAATGALIVVAWIALGSFIAPVFSGPSAALYPLSIPLILLAGLAAGITPWVLTVRALGQKDRRVVQRVPQSG